jgi:thiamine-phosphate pyrophosphorylase
LIGASTHSADTVGAAHRAGADFVTFGPVFASKSKRAYGREQGLEALRVACSTGAIPVFAIGGVTPERARACLDAGAHGVAAIGAVMEASSARSAVRAFAEALGGL